MMVNASGRSAGQKAHLLMPQLRENDTHCLILQYFVSGWEGTVPGQLNIYVKENNSPLGFPVWNSSGPASRTWGQLELAVSTFWPKFYQVRIAPLNFSARQPRRLILVFVRKPRGFFRDLSVDLGPGIRGK